jgi:hypothetical protein
VLYLESDDNSRPTARAHGVRLLGPRLSRRAFIRRTIAGVTARIASTMPNIHVREASAAASSSALAHRLITANGIQMHVAEQGRGPLVILATAFRNPGIRGDTSFLPWLVRDSARWRRIGAGMGGLTDRTKSISTRCSISLAT